MKFLDHLQLNLQAGNGGAGSSALFQDWHQKYPHCDGGNGGNGGSIFFIADKNLNTFSHFHHNSNLLAPSGINGQSKKKTGLNGKDLYLAIPLGTLVMDQTKKKILFNFSHDQEIFQIARGGKGGLGNAFWKSKTSNLEKNGQPGSLGEIVSVWLELILLADLALIGLPNAGKSSLLNLLSHAKGKVANYPFTTLAPNLGMLENEEEKITKRVIIADLPGLIAGASKNKGLGNQFLKHSERVKLFLHILDLSLPAGQIITNFQIINRELYQFHPYFAHIPQIIVANKVDLKPASLPYQFPSLANFSPKIFDQLAVSAKTHFNISQLKKIIYQTLASNPHLKTVLAMKMEEEKAVMTYTYHSNDEIRLQRLQKGLWRLSGSFFAKLAKKYNLTSSKELTSFFQTIKATPFYFYLKKAGLRPGDLVEIFHQNFYWQD